MGRIGLGDRQGGRARRDQLAEGFHLEVLGGVTRGIGIGDVLGQNLLARIEKIHAPREQPKHRKLGKVHASPVGASGP